MLPSTWNTDRLVCRDATEQDVALISAWLRESADVAALDPTFGEVDDAQIRHHLSRHLEAVRTGEPRSVQMQVFSTAEGPAGFWRLVRVPSASQAVGVEILLVRPAFRRSGLGDELVAATLQHLQGQARELWARVYLGNPRALAFWTRAGLRRVALHRDEAVHDVDGQRPSLILVADVGASTGSIEVTDAPAAADLEAVDSGLGSFNEQAAPLHEVAPLACWLRDAKGRLLGGAVGRHWSGCAELQQMWVDEAHRRSGLGTALMRAFEGAARKRGCHSIFLHTFSFQAPAFYRHLGYSELACNRHYPHGLTNHLMVKSWLKE